MAGGKAARLPESAKEKPKALVEVWGKPVLQHQVEHLLRHGLKNIRLSLGWRADQIIDFVKNRYPFIEYAVEKEPRGTGGAIKFALGGHDKSFIIMNGDILADCNMLNFMKQSANNANTMVVTQVKDAGDYGLVGLKDNLVAEFKEKPQINTPGLINASIHYLDPIAIKKFPKDIFSMEIDYFPELIKKRTLNYYVHEGFWIDMGTEERLRNLNNSPYFLK